MAVSVYWIYPPNYAGTPPARSGWRRITVEFRGDDLSASETAVKKIDISTLQAASGLACKRMALEKLSANIHNFDYIRLYWDHNTPVPIISLAEGFTKLDARGGGGLVDPGPTSEAKGSVMLTSIIDPIAVAAGNKASYSIKCTFRLKDD